MLHVGGEEEGRGVLGRLYRCCRAAQTVAKRLQAHSSAFERLNMDLRGREVPGPWPIPPVRPPLEMEARLLDSLTAAGDGGIFAVPVRAVCWTRLGLAGERRRRAPHSWTVRSCTPFRFLRGSIPRDSCRLGEPGGNCLRSSRGIHPILARRTAATYSVVGPNCCMGRQI